MHKIPLNYKTKKFGRSLQFNQNHFGQGGNPFKMRSTI
jgi:hypothetical protein